MVEFLTGVGWWLFGRQTQYMLIWKGPVMLLEVLSQEACISFNPDSDESYFFSSFW